MSDGAVAGRDAGTARFGRRARDGRRARRRRGRCCRSRGYVGCGGCWRGGGGRRGQRHVGSPAREAPTTRGGEPRARTCSSTPCQLALPVEGPGGSIGCGTRSRRRRRSGSCGCWRGRSLACSLSASRRRSDEQGRASAPAAQGLRVCAKRSRRRSGSPTSCEPAPGATVSWSIRVPRGGGVTVARRASDSSRSGPGGDGGRVASPPRSSRSFRGVRRPRRRRRCGRGDRCGGWCAVGPCRHEVRRPGRPRTRRADSSCRVPRSPAARRSSAQSAPRRWRRRARAARELQDRRAPRIAPRCGCSGFVQAERPLGLSATGRGRERCARAWPSRSAPPERRGLLEPS